MPEKQLAIFGAGGLGRELKSWIEKIESYRLIGFFDDHVAAGSDVGGVPVLGGVNDISRYTSKELNMVIALGIPEARAVVMNKLDTIPNLSFPVLIHPKAIIDDVATVRLGKGTVVTAGCVLTTNISIGNHVLVNLNATIGHDCEVGDGCCIMPGVNLSGQVTVGKHVLLGTGSCVLNNLNIGDYARVGAGAVVTRSLSANCTAVGVPAKPRSL